MPSHACTGVIGTQNGWLGMHIFLALAYSENSMLNFMLVNKEFLTWLQIGWWPATSQSEPWGINKHMQLFELRQINSEEFKDSVSHTLRPKKVFDILVWFCWIFFFVILLIFHSKCQLIRQRTFVVCKRWNVITKESIMFNDKTFSTSLLFHVNCIEPSKHLNIKAFIIDPYITPLSSAKQNDTQNDLRIYSLHNCAKPLISIITIAT